MDNGIFFIHFFYQSKGEIHRYMETVTRYRTSYCVFHYN